MTEKEAQKWLERFEWDDSEETSEALATICEALQEYPKFKEVGTIEEFKFLKQHKVLFKPNIYCKVENAEYVRCPCCMLTTVLYNGMRPEHCPKCGVKFDWQQIRR